jgi:hypothetical protein
VLGSGGAKSVFALSFLALTLDIFDALVEMVQASRERYFDTTSAIVKRTIVTEIIQAVEAKGRFLKKEHGVWVPVPMDVTHQKVAHAIQYRRRRSLKQQDEENSSTTAGAGATGNNSETSDNEASSSIPPKKSTTLNSRNSQTSNSSKSQPSYSRIRACRRRSRAALEENEDDADTVSSDAAVHHDTKPEEKKSEGSRSNKRCRRQCANDAARSWLQQAAFPLQMIKTLSQNAASGGIAVNPMAAKTLDVRASTTQPSSNALSDRPRILEGMEVAAAAHPTFTAGTVDPLDCSGVHSLSDFKGPLDCSGVHSLADFRNPLDCSGLHSLADLLNNIEAQDLWALTNHQHHSGSGSSVEQLPPPPAASLSLQKAMADVARQHRRSSAKFPMNIMATFSSSSMRQSSVGTFDSRLDDTDEAAITPDTFEPHSVQSVVDPLDCSGLHSLADVLNCMENSNHHGKQQQQQQDCAAAGAALSAIANHSIEHYITAVNKSPESLSASTRPMWYDEKTRITPSHGTLNNNSAFKTGFAVAL